MSGLLTCDRVITVACSSTGGLDVESYPTHFDVVTRLINSGYICSGGWGSSHHLKTLSALEFHIRRVRADIKKFNRKKQKRDRKGIVEF